MNMARSSEFSFECYWGGNTFSPDQRVLLPCEKFSNRQH